MRVEFVWSEMRNDLTNNCMPTGTLGTWEIVANGLTFPTSLTFEPSGTAYVAESGLPFCGALPGGRVWRLPSNGEKSLLAEGLRPPVNGLTFHQDSLYVSEGGFPG